MSGIEPPPPDGVRYRIWLFEPGPARDALAALFAIEREIDESARPELDHAVGHARLDWWREECGLLADGRPRHPATLRLAAALARPEAGPPDLQPLVEAARWRFAQLAFETRSELDIVLGHWASTVFATLLAIGGADPRAAQATAWRSFALRAGAAIRELELVGQLRTFALQGLVYLPLDELDAAGCEHADCRRQPFPGPVAALLRARFAACATTLRDAAGALPSSARIACRAALLWTSQALRQSARAAAALPLEYAPPRFVAIADTFAAWNAARRCLRGHLPRLA
jgi:phytoene synthase